MGMPRCCIRVASWRPYSERCACEAAEELSNAERRCWPRSPPPPPPPPPPRPHCCYPRHYFRYLPRAASLLLFCSFGVPLLAPLFPLLAAFEHFVDVFVERLGLFFLREREEFVHLLLLALPPAVAPFFEFLANLLALAVRELIHRFAHLTKKFAAILARKVGPRCAFACPGP